MREQFDSQSEQQGRRQSGWRSDDGDARRGWLSLGVTLLLIVALSVYYILTYGKVDKTLDASAKSAQDRRAESVTPAIIPQAPAFSLNDISGREVKLSDFRGKVVLLNFWATWCGPCKIETPWLVEFREQFSKQGVEVVGVSLDSLGEYDPAEIVAFAEKYQVKYPLLMGTRKFYEAYGSPQGIPITFIIDQQGRIRQRHRGLISFDALKREVKLLL